MGVIYGDIGTSPLYVFSSTFTAEPSYEDLVGVLSVIIVSIPPAINYFWGLPIRNKAIIFRYKDLASPKSGYASKANSLNLFSGLSL